MPGSIVWHNQKILELVHCTLFHVNDMRELYCNYFIVNKFVYSHDTCTRQRNDLHILYIKNSFGQSILEVFYGIVSPVNLKKPMTKLFKGKLKQYLLSEINDR